MGKWQNSSKQNSEIELKKYFEKNSKNTFGLFSTKMAF
jgi:hypothetical protein